jgi:hypothetical protein
VTPGGQPPKLSIRGLLLRAAVVIAVVTGLVLINVTREGGEESGSVAPSGQTTPVFDWSRDACEPIDVPDAPARAFRDANGTVQLIATSYVNRRMIGPNLNDLTHPCDVVMQSGYDPDPAHFDDREWITSPYTEDGVTVFALVHDEYQGNEHPGRCPAGKYKPCWFNSITYAVSRDGGRTYNQPPPPSQLVATVPYTYDPGTGPYGLFQPSNIVRNEKDGYYYALVRAQPYKEQPGGVCLMRTRTLSQPASWRAWDGSGFSISFIDPYAVPGDEVDPSQHLCKPVDPKITGMTQSLTYSTYFDKFLLVGARGNRGLKSGGIYYSLSDNLIKWTVPKLIKDVELVFTYQCGDEDPIAHPSLLDPASPSRNFDTVGKTPFLYYTLVRYADCTQTLDRDLLRVRVAFSK